MLIEREALFCTTKSETEAKDPDGECWKWAGLRHGLRRLRNLTSTNDLLEPAAMLGGFLPILGSGQQSILEQVSLVSAAENSLRGLVRSSWRVSTKQSVLLKPTEDVEGTRPFNAPVASPTLPGW